MKLQSKKIEMEKKWSALMAEAQSGNKSSYELLLNSLWAPLDHFFQHRLVDKSQSQDLVQETLLSLHRAMHTYDPNQPFAPWLYGIARFRLVDFLRKNRRKLNISDKMLQELELDPFLEGFGHVRAQRNQNEELNEDLTEALGGLPTRQKEAVLLLKQDDLSVKEAAQRMGVSVPALKVLAHRGYKQLKTLLERKSNK
jgi:RNA polymerase sigma-70 factor, ECF subfamily